MLRDISLVAATPPNLGGEFRARKRFSKLDIFIVSLGSVVSRHVLHLLRVEARGNTIHEMSIGRSAALLVLEQLELRDKVVCILTRMDRIVRIRRREAGAMAIHARGNALCRYASFGNFPAALDRFLVSS